MIQKTAPAANTPKSGKRSILGLLFNPRLGASLTPLRDNTRIFVRLLALVFSMYGLFPKDHPAIRDQNAPLSLREVMSESWKRVEFTRDGLPRTIIFFAVLMMMAVSFIAVISAIMSLFVGHAHAAVLDPGIFTAPNADTDIAQEWLTYLFGGPGGTFPTAGAISGGGDAAQLANPFASGFTLQTAFIACLAAYSNAILIVAALILFYHLAAMIVETAHHGQVMGKRANQIWAPIRLVFAIGLLVPVNSGLSSGQFIVIKIASLGSGLASNIWGSYFLPTLTAYNPSLAAPGSPAVTQVGFDIIRMEACRLAWNNRVAAQMSQINGATSYTYTTNPDASFPMSMAEPTGTAFTLGGIVGKKFSYTSNSLMDTDICGWYFIPGDGASTGNAFLNQAGAAQDAAIAGNLGAFQTAAGDMVHLMDTSATATPLQLANQSDAQSAVGKYQSDVQTAMANIAKGQNAQLQSAITTIGKYGWVLAGAFLNAIDRMQGDVASGAMDSLPKTTPPILAAVNVGDKPKQGWLSWFWNGDKSSNSAWEIRKQVADDMTGFDVYSTKVAASNNYSAQCAAMVGLQTTGSGGPSGGLAESALGTIEQLAESQNLWSTSSGATCGAGGPAPGAQTFSLGITINNVDPFTQMAELGHANLAMAIELTEAAIAAQFTGAVASYIPIAGQALSAGAGGVAGIFVFFAVIFWTCGFTLAYMVPLMPFMRFFLAVITWVAALIEAIIAVPLIALAHLNPEGDGLAGQAKQSYGFLLALFLRPTLCVFGLICGLVVFLIALSLLNFGYGVAVAGAGGTAYGHAALSHIVYSLIYVALVYTCANHCFQLIDHLPNQAMQWMSMSGPSPANMGNISHFEGIGTAVGGFAGSKALPGMSNMAGTLRGGITSANKSKADKADQAISQASNRAFTQDQTGQITSAIREGHASGGGDTPPPTLGPGAGDGAEHDAEFASEQKAGSTDSTMGSGNQNYATQRDMYPGYSNVSMNAGYPQGGVQPAPPMGYSGKADAQMQPTQANYTLNGQPVTAQQPGAGGDFASAKDVQALGADVNQLKNDIKKPPTA